MANTMYKRIGLVTSSAVLAQALSKRSGRSPGTKS